MKSSPRRETWLSQRKKVWNKIKIKSWTRAQADITANDVNHKLKVNMNIKFRSLQIFATWKCIRGIFVSLLTRITTNPMFSAQWTPLMSPSWWVSVSTFFFETKLKGKRQQKPPHNHTNYTLISSSSSNKKKEFRRHKKWQN